MIHPLFGLFAEPATTVLLSTAPGHIAAIEKLAGEFKFMMVRVGTTGGTRLEITVDREPFIAAEIAELRKPWSSALESALHNEVTA